MKKIFLTILTSFLAVAGLYAQSAGPNELTCTEQAITFKASLRPGWQFNTVQVGHPEMIKGLPGFAHGWSYHNGIELMQGLPAAFEKAFMMGSNMQPESSTPSLSDILGNSHTTDKLNYIFHNHNQLQVITVNQTASAFIH